MIYNIHLHIRTWEREQEKANCFNNDKGNHGDHVTDEHPG